MQLKCVQICRLSPLLAAVIKLISSNGLLEHSAISFLLFLSVACPIAFPLMSALSTRSCKKMLFMRFCSAKILDGSRQSTQPEIVARELDRGRQRQREVMDGERGDGSASWAGLWTTWWRPLVGKSKQTVNWGTPLKVAASWLTHFVPPLPRPSLCHLSHARGGMVC